MNHPLFRARFFLMLLVSFSVFSQVAKIRAQEKKLPTLSSLQLEFDVRRAELLKPTRDLQQKYGEQLKQLMDQATKAGDLEKSLAVKAELAGFQKGESKPAGNEFPELKRLQGIYTKTYAKRIALMNRELKSVFENHQAKLLTLQTELTKRQKLDEAVIVKAEIAKMNELAKASQEGIAPQPQPAGSPGGTNANATPVQVAKSVRAKSGVEEPAENVIPFDAPMGDGRSGAKGILVKSEGGGEEGSTWMFRYTRAGSAQEVQVIHPRGKGQAIVHIRPAGIGISTPGEWRAAGYGGGDSESVRTKDAYDEIFPMEVDREYAITSRMDPAGSGEIFIDGTLVATFRARTAKPLVLDIPEGAKIPGGSGWAKLEFKGEGLPFEWQEHWAGILVGPLDGGIHGCEDVHYCVGLAPGFGVTQRLAVPPFALRP